MSIEITMLTYSVGLLFVLVLIQATAGVLAQGLPKMAGARDDLGPPGVFQARTKRLVDNHREGLTLMAPLILAAAFANISNQWTVLGAQIFFVARVIHAAIYLAGLPWIRPLPWAAGIIGTVMVFLALIGVLV